jgi:hypothetical protein
VGEVNRIGAAGRHRREEDRQDDTGELRVAVGAHKGRVVLNFGRAVAWLSMDPVEARNVAAMLLERASKVDGKSTTITMGV